MASTGDARATSHNSHMHKARILVDDDANITLNEYQNHPPPKFYVKNGEYVKIHKKRMNEMSLFN